jgi:hypothetical protein
LIRFQIIINGGKRRKLVVVTPLFGGIGKIAGGVRIPFLCFIKHIPAQLESYPDVRLHEITVLDGKSAKAWFTDIV